MKNLIFKLASFSVCSFSAGASLILMTSGCGTQTPSASAGEFAPGRRIFLTQCTRCHGVRPIQKYSAEEWREILDDMSGRAKLDAAQRAQLRAYVLASAR